MYGAAIANDVPRSTLRDALAKKGNTGHFGAPTALTKAEEDQLVKYVLYSQRVGYPLTMEELRTEVQKIVGLHNRKTPFTDGRPGTHKM